MQLFSVAALSSVKDEVEFSISTGTEAQIRQMDQRFQVKKHMICDQRRWLLAQKETTSITSLRIKAICLQQGKKRERAEAAPKRVLAEDVRERERETLTERRAD